MKNIKNNQKIHPHRSVLKTILNFWTVITIGLFTLDFFSGNAFDSASTSVGIIYLALLGIYVSEKEYTRWSNHFISRFFGESFVLVWTVLMVMFVILAPLSQGAYRVPQELAIIYTSVIGVFAITRHSRIMNETKNTKRLSKKK